ncbi:glucuronate isomerase [Dactylosporangium sp. McL0621]|uniref:glucuronate isomerase n=1 Tax=Dactylosporangium sp. McL0621 TaxID=3415678 RepID=UPI003CEC2AFA
MIDLHQPLAPHPDRLLHVDPAVRAIARELYRHVAGAPIISPHGHVDPKLLVENQPFSDPATLLVTRDHYVTRLLHAAGVQLDRLGAGQDPLPESVARSIWRLLCEHWGAFAGTPVRYWLESELFDIFGVREQPTVASADSIYDEIVGCLARAEFLPRALFDKFGIEVLATTDDPCDDLSAHRALAADASWHGRVIPTFRPDRYLEPAESGWRAAVDRLADVAGVDTGDYDGYLLALETRRAFFREHGATATDHSHTDVRAEPIDDSEARRIYRTAREQAVTASEAAAFRRHMIFQMARMSTEDGLVMTLHPGISRNHHRPTYLRHGPDTGHDIPVRAEFTLALRPLLEAFGTHPNLHLVLFTVDETTFSREIGPLAGFYPSVYAGAPWWFLDAPDAIRRYRAAITETAGFNRTSGFIDDTRAFCSIPARHDMSRRLDAGYLAGLVAEHRLGIDEATTIATDMVGALPRRVFKL